VSNPRPTSPSSLGVGTPSNTMFLETIAISIAGGMSINPAVFYRHPHFFLSSAAADNVYQAMNTLAPGKVARIKPSNEMQAYSEQRPKSFGLGNITHLYLNFHIVFNRK